VRARSVARGDGRALLWLRVIRPAGASQTLDATLFTDALNQQFFGDLGVTYPRAGFGLLTLNDSDDVGGVVITPQTPSSGYDGPFYSKDGVEVDRDAGATYGSGIVNVVLPAGSAVIQVKTSGGAPCRQLSGGWGSNDAGTITVPILENTETSVFFTCL
jgi:hypothetical protein